MEERKISSLGLNVGKKQPTEKDGPWPAKKKTFHEYTKFEKVREGVMFPSSRKKIKVFNFFIGKYI